MSDPLAQQAVQQAARESYGRLLAWLTSRCRDIAMAEDALGDALASALQRWPEEGVPSKPEAWLLTVARRRLIDQQRRLSTQQNAAQELAFNARLRLNQEASEASSVPFRDGLPDRRLELMFMCAHPQIPAAMRTPLMLQAVLGLNAQTIGAAMLVAPSTIGQRLVRVKRRIVDEKVPFEVPDDSQLPERLSHVLEAVYAAYGSGWEADPTQDVGRAGLAQEALWLSRLLVALLPQAAETKGLYALLCFCESRRSARRTDDGQYVPLEEQDTDLWDHDLILEGEKALWLASRQREAGPYQTEAAIHSAHAHRARSGHTSWQGIHRLYELLVRMYPSLGAQVSYAASFGRVGQPQQGLDRLDALPSPSVERHQPYWAVRAWLLSELGQVQPARDAYDRAIGLCGDDAVRRWLQAQRARLKT